MHLNAFLMNVGHHEAAWRHPAADPAAATTLAHYVELARTAERGRLDSIFFADGLAVAGNIRHNTQGGLDPLAVLNAVAGHTSHIGLIATVSTTFTEPYATARAFATLDHLSGGRAGWNIVTSGREAEAHNFGLDAHPDHRVRYQRADEFVDVVTRLWDSWEDGALVRDKASGLYADTARIHELDHRGSFFAVRGPLTVPRSPQGRPLLVQAGSSEDGRQFAARHADAIFTAWQDLDEAQAFYADVKGQAAALGRDPDRLVVLPGIVPVLGPTEAAARTLARELDELLVWDYGLAQLGGILTVPLTAADLDRPLADLPLPDPEQVNGNRSRFTLVADLGRRERLTVRQVIGRLAGGRGHRVVVGTPEQVADTMAAWFTHRAADGFNVMPPLLPAGLVEFVDTVVPILRDRGLFRHDYAGVTLRGHYGLPRPPARPAGAADAARGTSLAARPMEGSFADRRTG
jgi:FMN-dependent oxidoreductase (nitrilotriacetate monooxygenase family)